MNDLTTTSPQFLQPTNFAEFERFAKMIADSDFAPKDYRGKPGNVMIAVQMGYELGLKPIQALQNISVISNRAVIWGDLLIALIRKQSSCKYIKEWVEGSIKDNTAIAYCEIMRGDEIITRTFSIDQARRAGLTGKQGPWQSYPERMLAMRARGFCARDAYADTLKGLYVREELDANAFNDQDLDSPPVKIGNEAIKTEIIENEITTLGSKQASDELCESILSCATEAELRDIGLKIKEANLSMHDKKRLADAYRERLTAIKDVSESEAEKE